MSDPIITSLLDTDLYKLTMMNAVRSVAPDAIVQYRFVCRSSGANDILVNYVLPRFHEQVDHLCSLRFQEAELEYLRRNVPYLPSPFVDFSLRRFQLLSSCVEAGTDGEGRFYLEVVGPWYDTIFFEVPLLAIIEELYMDYQVNWNPEIENVFASRLTEKIEWLKSQCRWQGEEFTSALSLTDMGTRRRRSGKWHRFVVEALAEELGGVFTGTSNVQLAMDLGLKCFGTMAHEWIQAFQGMTRFDLSQEHALNAWQRIYGGNLGIALSDTLGTDMFLHDFNAHLANAFTGVRHDSGDPIEWASKMVDHYASLGIDPATKTLVFSDSLDFEKMCHILQRFVPLHPSVLRHPKCGFGIGTFLTNDSTIDGVKHRIDIVLKMVMFNEHPVMKKSNVPGKTVCISDAYQAFAEEQIARMLKRAA